MRILSVNNYQPQNKSQNKPAFQMKLDYEDVVLPVNRQLLQLVKNGAEDKRIKFFIDNLLNFNPISKRFTEFYKGIHEKYISQINELRKMTGGLENTLWSKINAYQKQKPSVEEFVEFSQKISKRFKAQNENSNEMFSNLEGALSPLLTSEERKALSDPSSGIKILENKIIDIYEQISKGNISKEDLLKFFKTYSMNDFEALCRENPCEPALLEFQKAFQIMTDGYDPNGTAKLYSTTVSHGPYSEDILGIIYKGADNTVLQGAEPSLTHMDLYNKKPFIPENYAWTMHNVNNAITPIDLLPNQKSDRGIPHSDTIETTMKILSDILHKNGHGHGENNAAAIWLGEYCGNTPSEKTLETLKTLKGLAAEQV